MEGRQQFVYLISREGLQKIGVSRQPKIRLQCFVRKGRGATLIHSFPSLQSWAVEKQIHHAFLAKRVKGEWFNLSEEDVKLIASIIRCDSVEDLPDCLRSSTPLQPKRPRGFGTSDGCGLIHISERLMELMICVRAGFKKCVGFPPTDQQLIECGLRHFAQKHGISVPPLPQPTPPPKRRKKGGDS